MRRAWAGSRGWAASGALATRPMSASTAMRRFVAPHFNKQNPGGCRHAHEEIPWTPSSHSFTAPRGGACLLRGGSTGGIMSEINRTALFGKLNSLAYKAIEGATVFCKMRGNPYVELEHWFAQLLQSQDSDLHRVIQHYGLDISVIAKDMTAALDRLPRGATAISDFSPHIENAIERAWTYATLQFGEAQVRTGYLLVAMLKTPSLRNPLMGLSKQFEKVKVEDLADNFA